LIIPIWIGSDVDMNTGQYPPPPPPAYNNPQPHRYKGLTLAALINGYLLACVFFVLELMVTGGTNTTTDTTTSSGSGILGTTSVLLFLAVNISIMLLDGSSFFSLFGKIQWRRLKGWQRILLGFVYLSFCIMPLIYFVVALEYFSNVRQQSVGKVMAGWYRAKSPGARKSVVVVSLLLILSFAMFTSFAAIANRSSALVLLTPTASSQQTTASLVPTDTPGLNVAATDVATADTPTTLSDTPTVVPTKKPTPASKPTPRPCGNAGCNPWNYDFNPGNLIYYPPGNFCSYFNCIVSFYSSDDPGDGYIVECQDSTYSQSGGERGACSYHGGVLQPLYSH
jgi:hypothetical protein